MNWRVMKERIRETWMCESTEWLAKLGQTAEFGADLALYYSKRLQRFTEARFRAYVSEANESWEREQDAAQSPSAPPEFSDPQHGASAGGVSTTACPYGRAPNEQRCVGCSCAEREGEGE